MFCSAHSNINKFVDISLNVQCDTSIKIRNTNVNNKKNNIEKMKKLETKEISKFEYIQSLSEKFSPI